MVLSAWLRVPVSAGSFPAHGGDDRFFRRYGIRCVRRRGVSESGDKGKGRGILLLFREADCGTIGLKAVVCFFPDGFCERDSFLRKHLDQQIRSFRKQRVTGEGFRLKFHIRSRRGLEMKSDFSRGGPYGVSAPGAVWK